ncbi:XRE family transcriptional regulator [Bacillus paranthracis]|uniref:XRE family transcriptional regulator n=1 Tax=Bacillus paranthracis TaxID=2026186 RepID=UPI00148F00FA|nr:XRE family transcriptional regulator [Bacillus paranthracis]NOP79618.1 XRE family transcriptional regulator [Bacillus paranthracis]
MYNNLLAEMARKGISKKDIAETLDMRYPTLVDKTNGKFDFTTKEAFAIKTSFFPELPIDYLFHSENVEKMYID